MILDIFKMSDLVSHLIAHDKKEIRAISAAHDCTVFAADFQNETTYETPLLRECRGITFRNGFVVGRPLHKFFNLNERPETQQHLINQEDIYMIREKLDGSMIHTVDIDGKAILKSKKSFTSDVAKSAQKWIEQNQNYMDFCNACVNMGFTAIFEYVDPNHRIVINHKTSGLHLLYIRNNFSGHYLSYDLTSIFANQYGVNFVRKVDLSFKEVLDSLETMTDMEGYVIHLKNEDMIKLKCPWYVRLHKTITFLRERDIAEYIINEEIDDVISMLESIGASSTRIREMIEEIFQDLVGIAEECYRDYLVNKHLTRKDFAIKFNGHKYFGLLMGIYSDKEPDFRTWYKKNIMPQKYGLNVITEYNEE